jgi:phosphate transport system permease protein
MPYQSPERERVGPKDPLAHARGSDKQVGVFMTRTSFTGHTRKRTNRWSVRITEIVARVFITVGGIGTIIAIGLVCFYLLQVAWPLFESAKIREVSALPGVKESAKPLRAGTDDLHLQGWVINPDGELHVRRLDDGHELFKQPLFADTKITACSPTSADPPIAFGCDDGTVRFAAVSFAVTDEKDLPESFRELKPGQIADHDGGIVTRRENGILQGIKVKVDVQAPIELKPAVAVGLIDRSVRSKGPILAILTTDGKLHINSIRETENFITGEPMRELSGVEMDSPRHEDKGPPQHLLVSGQGDDVYLIWDDGTLVRIDIRDLESPKVVEEVNLLGSPDLKLTSVQFLVGKLTLMVGDSSGRLRAWFLAKPVLKPGEKSPTDDGRKLFAAHEFPATGSAVTAMAASTRNRLLSAGYANGEVRLFYVTSENFLEKVSTKDGKPVTELILTPKDDGLLVITEAGTFRYDLDAGYPEITTRSILMPVWYEGYPEPKHVWQTTAPEGSEPKYSLSLLIFGTLKATFYAMLMAVPLALLAAIYTSEFLHRSTRAIVKPSIEMMASLPSVVLGFIGALVVAPFVGGVLPAVLALFLTVPISFVLCAYLWQMLPEKLSLRLARWKFIFICVVIPLGIGAAVVVGPILERVLFAGDVKKWLNGEGPAWRGLFLILLAPCTLGTIVLMARYVNPWYRGFVSGMPRFQNALADLGKFVAAALATMAIALVLALLLSKLGFDPRGTSDADIDWHPVGNYVERNALVVGFMLGFAIIPIIYTIADDALTSVPEHLRSASLGCGATPWQTATRVIIPTAMSGIFSAVMVGLGRAVGETMIVLLCAGNTPIWRLNLFEGFRTLSANIAVEVPDSERYSSHFRMLFLSALALFAMTFVLNTGAEVIRQRFRKRAFQL